jgi:hypothetical protein
MPTVLKDAADGPVWHTPPGIALLGPRHFGFDFDHVPLELVERRA